MDDVIEINDSDSNECTITGKIAAKYFEVMFMFVGYLGYQQGIKRKADDDVYFSESSVPSSHSEQSDGEEEPILVESSESEPEFDCEDWDTDCRVVDVTPVGERVCGCMYAYFLYLKVFLSLYLTVRLLLNNHRSC